MKRICSNCKKPIAKSHRWHHVHHRFWFWTWTTLAHRDCEHPTEIHKNVLELSGAHMDEPIIYGLPAEQNLGGDVYHTYGGIKRNPGRDSVSLQRNQMDMSVKFEPKHIDVEKFTA